MPVKQCPLNPEYMFTSQCRIKGCKYHSPFTKNKCLGLDIKFSSDEKPMSNAELLHYKFADKKIPIKEVDKIRKRSLEKAKLSVQLYNLVRHISEKCDPTQGSNYIRGTSDIIDEIISNPPLSLEVFGFETWMLEFLADEDFVSNVVGQKFKLKDALLLKPKKCNEFLNAVKELS